LALCWRLPVWFTARVGPLKAFFTLFAILFVFVGLQFFALGVIGEYIGRIYREVRKRPEYVIENIYQAKEDE